MSGWDQRAWISQTNEERLKRINQYDSMLRDENRRMLNRYLGIADAANPANARSISVNESRDRLAQNPLLAKLSDEIRAKALEVFDYSNRVAIDELQGIIGNRLPHLNLERTEIETLRENYIECRDNEAALRRRDNSVVFHPYNKVEHIKPAKRMLEMESVKANEAKHLQKSYNDKLAEMGRLTGLIAGVTLTDAAITYVVINSAYSGTDTNVPGLVFFSTMAIVTTMIAAGHNFKKLWGKCVIAIGTAGLGLLRVMSGNEGVLDWYTLGLLISIVLPVPVLAYLAGSWCERTQSIKNDIQSTRQAMIDASKKSSITTAMRAKVDEHNNHLIQSSRKEAEALHRVNQGFTDRLANSLNRYGRRLLAELRRRLDWQTRTHNQLRDQVDRVMTNENRRLANMLENIYSSHERMVNYHENNSGRGGYVDDREYVREWLRKGRKNGQQGNSGH